MGGDVVILALGLAVLLAGGEALVRGASGIAQSLGVSPLVVGLTVVSFGTSAPELAVNLLAVAEGEVGLSYGNIVGSNLANIGLIVALASLLRPLDVRSVVLARELPMLLLATLVALVAAADGLLRSGASAAWDRSDGLVLLLVFTVFVYYTANELVAQRNHRRPGAAGIPAVRPEMELEVEGGGGAAEGRAVPSLRRLGLTVALGALGLAVGAKLTVDGAMGVARTLGISETIIGLTLVAVGTSLPELVASLIAAFRREADLAVGNVVGSNIFNLLLIGGLCASLRPIPVPVGGLTDLLMSLALAILLWVMGFTLANRIIRAEGATLLLLYVLYMSQRALFAAGG